MATGVIKNYDGWMLAGTSTSSIENVTYPSTAKELFIIFTISSNDTVWAYETTTYVEFISSVGVLVIGGHYYASNTYGYVFANHDGANRTLNLRGYNFPNATNPEMKVYCR